jgi:hypothetical protein
MLRRLLSLMLCLCSLHAAAEPQEKATRIVESIGLERVIAEYFGAFIAGQTEERSRPLLTAIWHPEDWDWPAINAASGARLQTVLSEDEIDAFATFLQSAPGERLLTALPEFVKRSFAGNTPPSGGSGLASLGVPAGHFSPEDEQTINAFFAAPAGKKWLEDLAGLGQRLQMLGDGNTIQRNMAVNGCVFGALEPGITRRGMAAEEVINFVPSARASCACVLGRVAEKFGQINMASLPTMPAVTAFIIESIQLGDCPSPVARPQ